MRTCVIHHRDENPNDEDYYIQCFECGHVYLKAEDLVQAYQEASKVHNLPAPEKDADKIFFCQECLHDF